MTSNNRTVTVIGAGLAGLAAAYDLHRAGWNVTVLEARERVGGRVYSVRSFSNGLVAEGGGEFIEDRHVRMLAFAKQFNLQLGRVGSWQKQDGDWGAFEGKSGRLADEKIWGTNLHEEIERVWDAVSGLGKYVPDSKQPQTSREAERLDAQSALDWINAQDVHPLARNYFIQHIRAEYTTEPECFSLLDLARNSSMYYSTAEHQPNWRVVGGNDLIPRALANALPDIRMNAVVTSIRILPDEVAVTYKQADSHLTVSSAFAILAIPLTTARLIDFNSSLPYAHQRMVNEISYGAVTKVMIQYRKRFWDKTGWNGRLTTDSPIVITWLATSHVESEDGIITAYTGGSPGAKLAALSDEARVQLAVAEIEKFFPGSSDLIEHTATAAWPNEPFTRGSYMALAPGEVTAHWQTLFEPAGRLFFAGEHATAIQGYMEGAVESGQRAAASIISS
ncbi:MAG: FAD-dependent oxidoreductase [Anaerolineae bacterium]|nr:FAD-dependent oxidoreductase [Anaerolineae bacterium]MCI0609949.1 FAD-dependent oxidoreductase [Anaerolineae bacterium]